MGSVASLRADLHEQAMEDVARDQYAITCTNAAWPWPDIYGPFPTREAAERFVNEKFEAWVIKGDVVQWKIDPMLNPEEYE